MSKIASARGAASVVVIESTRGWLPARPRELWPYRELYAFLVHRDIKVRYAQTVLGAVWTVFQPLSMMLVYTYAFSKLAKVDTGSIPYPLFALSGLVVWLFVSRAVLQGAASLINDIPLVTKTSSPRLIIPLSSVTSALVDFIISLGLFLVFAAAYGKLPGVRFFAIPFILVPILALTLGLALLLSALNVRYRDVGQALPFIVQLWFFLSPVAYLLHTPGHSLSTIVQIANPLFGLIGATRWALVGATPPTGAFLLAIGESFACLVVGLAYFSHAERTIADDA